MGSLVRTQISLASDFELPVNFEDWQSAIKWHYIGANGPTDAIVSNPNMIS